MHSPHRGLQGVRGGIGKRQVRPRTQNYRGSPARVKCAERPAASSPGCVNEVAIQIARWVASVSGCLKLEGLDWRAAESLEPVLERLERHGAVRQQPLQLRRRPVHSELADAARIPGDDELSHCVPIGWWCAWGRWSPVTPGAGLKPARRAGHAWQPHTDGGSGDLFRDGLDTRHRSMYGASRAGSARRLKTFEISSAGEGKTWSWSITMSIAEPPPGVEIRAIGVGVVHLATVRPAFLQAA